MIGEFKEINNTSFSIAVSDAVISDVASSVLKPLKNKDGIRAFSSSQMTILLFDFLSVRIIDHFITEFELTDEETVNIHVTGTNTNFEISLIKFPDDSDQISGISYSLH